MKESKYDEAETRYLVDGFKNGFDIEYNGPEERWDYSKNIPFKSVGSNRELWDKLMKEVQLKRYAGPFNQVPFTNFPQSPIGLVPKAGNKTRLIFHLSYDFLKTGNLSINKFTKREAWSMRYNDLDEAVKIGIKLMGKDKKWIYCSKTDLTTAFRMIPLHQSTWKWLTVKAKNPDTGEMQYFFDKCLPFSHSISCAIFQCFSNALKHLAEFVLNSKDCIVNYLDDFLFLATSKEECNRMVEEFTKLCKKLGVPIAEEKTELGDTRIVFLGILIDGQAHILSIPEEKRIRTINMLTLFSSKRKATVKDIQWLSGYLNFLTKAIFPGRTFT